MAATELSIPYTLTAPNGATAVFNDTTDPNYVGMIRDVTGFDSPDVRESADDLVQQDGGIHGDFFYGRRPITLSGTILNPLSASERNQRIDRLSAASNALRGDALLTWTPTGGDMRMMVVRRNQPLRVTGAWQKDFQLALVAADPRIYSYAVHSTGVSAGAPSSAGRGYNKSFPIVYGPAAPSGQLVVSNAGDAETFPLLRITGPGTNPTLINLTTGQQLAIVYTLAASEYLVVDMLNRTVLLNGSANRYGAVDFVNSEWFPIIPGDNDLRIGFSSFSTGAALQVDWRDAWL